jgi:uncharacterized protein (UPF0303 family)
MVAPSRKMQPPTKEEWMKRKNEIVRLYADMPLNHVQRQMEQEHNLKAKYACATAAISLLRQR